MNILLVLIPLSLILVIAAVYAFFWAVDNDQFEDLETPAIDILADDDVPRPARPLAWPPPRKASSPCRPASAR